MVVSPGEGAVCQTVPVFSIIFSKIINAMIVTERIMKLNIVLRPNTNSRKIPGFHSRKIQPQTHPVS